MLLRKELQIEFYVQPQMKELDSLVLFFPSCRHLPSATDTALRTPWAKQGLLLGAEEDTILILLNDFLCDMKIKQTD